eukprot:TRINITY_DN14655_c0_g1_i1.p1 TRINITY_DN14655_c0_g1~~TRINITY_DN14655_c0_g1_i1.p1  ORF type:complete len:428 (-),score=59.93 TRINITY_DN14655_c0_g1_i1:76-1359(-)
MNNMAYSQLLLSSNMGNIRSNMGTINGAPQSMQSTLNTFNPGRSSFSQRDPLIQPKSSPGLEYMTNLSNQLSVDNSHLLNQERVGGSRLASAQSNITPTHQYSSMSHIKQPQPSYSPSGEILAMLGNRGTSVNRSESNLPNALVKPEFYIENGVPPELPGFNKSQQHSDLSYLNYQPQIRESGHINQNYLLSQHHSHAQPAIYDYEYGRSPVMIHSPQKLPSSFVHMTPPKPVQSPQSQPPPSPSLFQLPPSPSSFQPSQSSSQDPYGLLGLLKVIRMTDPDLNILALGQDLTTLGLNLSSTEPLYTTFESPWSEHSLKREKPEFNIPMCYFIRPRLSPPFDKLNLFSDETLFYIFYNITRDALQLAAAQELYNRDWRYHTELQLWFQRLPGAEPIVKTQNFERGSYICFDINSWEKNAKRQFCFGI